VKDKATTIAGLGIGGGVLLGLISQAELLLDNDPATGDWRIVLALAVAVIAVPLWGYFTNKDTE
jgi:hypothetical protein